MEVRTVLLLNLCHKSPVDGRAEAPIIDARWDPEQDNIVDFTAR